MHMVAGPEHRSVSLSVKHRYSFIHSFSEQIFIEHPQNVLGAVMAAGITVVNYPTQALFSGSLVPREGDNNERVRT